MRVSTNVPASIAAILFFIAWLGCIGAISVNPASWTDGGLIFLALTGLVVFNRGNTA